MSFEVRVAESGSTISNASASNGKHRIGSDAGCEIIINHPDVAPVAAVLEVTSGVAFLENRNAYPIFVGQNQLPPGQVAEWRVGSLVQLTRSISLALETTETATIDSSDAAEEGKNQTQTMVQIGVIVVCAILVFNMLTSDSSSSREEDLSIDTFDELVERFEKKGGPRLTTLSLEERTLLGYLTEARAIEMRWGAAKRDEARAAYEIILSSSSDAESGSLEAKVRRYAQSRINLQG